MINANISCQNGLYSVFGTVLEMTPAGKYQSMVVDPGIYWRAYRVSIKYTFRVVYLPTIVAVFQRQLRSAIPNCFRGTVSKVARLQGVLHASMALFPSYGHGYILFCTLPYGEVLRQARVELCPHNVGIPFCHIPKNKADPSRGISCNRKKRTFP